MKAGCLKVSLVEGDNDDDAELRFSRFATVDGAGSIVFSAHEEFISLAGFTVLASGLLVEWMVDIASAVAGTEISWSVLCILWTGLPYLLGLKPGILMTPDVAGLAALSAFLKDEDEAIGGSASSLLTAVAGLIEV